MDAFQTRIDALSKELGISRNRGRRLISLVVDALAEQLNNGRAVELRKLGTFYAAPGPSKASSARSGTSTMRVHFLPSPSLERQLNQQIPRIREYVEDQSMMHTTIELKIIHHDRSLVRSVMDETFQLFRRYEAAYNFYDPQSDLTSLNSHPGEYVLLSEEFLEILKKCSMVGQKSDGAYDITIGPVVKLWNFGAKKPRVPPEDRIKELLPKVNFRTISFKDGMVSIAPGISVDLSGAIKGFAADAGQLLFRERGITNGMVNAGRNIYVLGQNVEGVPWRIGVVHPREPGTLIAFIHLQDEAIATSGDYERYFFEGGRHYHHLLDPHTGYPSRGCVAVTVVSKSAALTDMLSTAAFILGPERGKRLLADLDCHGLFITRQGIEATPGLQPKLEFLCDPKDVVKRVAQDS